MSIVHLVCWKYKAETEQGVRDEHIAGLRALWGIIPDIIEFEVGSDIIHLDRSFDTGLYSRFRDTAALQAYTDHPEHQKVAALGKQIAEKVVSVDFDSEN
jgi:Stress responsive A/B Barrel Domain